MSNFREYPNDEYGRGILLEEYNGTYSLVLAKQGEGDKVWKEWVAPIYKKKPIDKMLPWKIELGDSEAEAVETLRYFIELLGGTSGTQDDDDIPF